MNKILKTFMIVIVVLSVPSYAMQCAEFSGEEDNKNAINNQNEKGKDVKYHDKEFQPLGEFTNGEKSFELYKLPGVENISKQIEIIAQQPNATDVLYRLGEAAYNRKSYDDARLYFEKLVDIGFESSSKDVLEMIRDGKIPTFLDIPTFQANQFFAIYILNGCEFPAKFNRKGVKFIYGMPEMNNDTTTKGYAGLCTKILNNTGFISFPFMWIQNPNGLDNEDTIETKMLIVEDKVIEGGESIENGFYRFEGFPRRHKLQEAHNLMG